MSSEATLQLARRKACALMSSCSSSKLAGSAGVPLIRSTAPRIQVEISWDRAHNSASLRLWISLSRFRSAMRSLPALRDRTHALAWSWAPLYAGLDGEACLVHGDFNKRNLLVRCVGGRWTVAAVLDWEFAVSSSPLADLASFLRYERAARPVAEPHFSAGYVRAGGRLPHNWRRLARWVDLVAPCQSVTA